MNARLSNDRLWFLQQAQHRTVKSSLVEPAPRIAKQPGTWQYERNPLSILTIATGDRQGEHDPGCVVGRVGVAILFQLSTAIPSTALTVTVIRPVSVIGRQSA